MSGSGEDGGVSLGEGESRICPGKRAAGLKVMQLVSVES